MMRENESRFLALCTRAWLFFCTYDTNEERWEELYTLMKDLRAAFEKTLFVPGYQFELQQVIEMEDRLLGFTEIPARLNGVMPLHQCSLKCFDFVMKLQSSSQLYFYEFDTLFKRKRSIRKEIEAYETDPSVVDQDEKVRELKEQLSETEKALDALIDNPAFDPAHMIDDALGENEEDAFEA